MTEISRQIIGVGDLNRTIAGVLDAHIGNVWVRGEISNFKAYDSGHWYFSLNDYNKLKNEITQIYLKNRT